MKQITCSILTAHPFIYGLGLKTNTGSYLSPENAIEYIANKLAGTGQASVLVLMVTGKTFAEFMQVLSAFSAVFPLPVFSQVERMARTAETLAATKMQIPGKIAGGLPLPQALSTTTSRMASNSQLIEAAKAAASQPSGLDSMKSALSDFSKQKDNTLKQMNDALNGVLGKSTTVWAFSGTDDATILAEEMRKNIPDPDAVYTLATLFAGDEITVLTRMLNDTDNYPRPER
ncbi:hypothetical protein AB7W30_16735 [Providencia manganoxydans]|uniref:hypothetical protein n=1 Tax=Providencia manganoxydans TaxID=2923283 RepID=UPI0032DABF0A